MGPGILRQNQDSLFNQSNLSLYTTGPSEYLKTSGSGSSAQSNTNAETRSRYSPMFVQYDSLSSPFSLTAFGKSPEFTQKTKIVPQDVSEAKLPIHQELSRGPLIIPPHETMRSHVTDLHSDRFKLPKTTRSVLRSDALEFLVPGIKENEERASSGLENLGSSSLPVSISDPSRFANTSVSRTRTEVPTFRSKDTGPLPDVSALSITDDSQINTGISPLVQRELGSRRYSDFVPKSAMMLGKDEDDSEIDDQSDTDSDEVGVHDLEAPAIDVSSEVGSEEDSAPSQTKRAGSQKNNALNVSVLELYKTEICLNWLRTRNCSYGNKCHYAHGVADLRTRQRIETYKTQPCADPARSGCHVCMYTSRCNYAHPGEPIRRMGPHPRKKYYDPEYFEALRRDYPHHEMPFGVFV